jgi:uroporphyrinogen-III synthase
MRDLDGLKVVLFDRRDGVLARGLRARGGVPYCVAVLRQSCAECDDATLEFLRLGAAGAFSAFVLPSVDDARGLVREAMRLGHLGELLSALKGAPVACGAPTAAAVLREHGVEAAAVAREPYGGAELLEVLATVELRAAPAAVVYHGERHSLVSEGLARRGVACHEVALNEALLPHEVRLVESLVQDLFSDPGQPGYLMQVAREMGLGRELTSMLGETLLVAALDSDCVVALRGLGLNPHVACSGGPGDAVLDALARRRDLQNCRI